MYTTVLVHNFELRDLSGKRSRITKKVCLIADVNPLKMFSQISTFDFSGDGSLQLTDRREKSC